MPTFPRLLVCLLALGGCSAATDARLPDSEPEAEDRLGELPDEDQLYKQVCSPDRYVAVLSSGTQCPQLNGWSGSRVFPDAWLHETAEDDSLPPELARYCRYRWTDDGVPPWQQFETHPAFESVGRDCRAIAPQSDPISDALAPALRDNFRWLAGRLDANDLDSANSEASRAPTTVAVVDTLPKHEPTNALSNHGPVMQAIIEDLACPDSTCAVETPAYLGLPRTDKGINIAQGGYMGTYSDLARAVYRSTEEHRAAMDSGTSDNLIINLSLGWEPSLFGDVGGSPAVDAVFSAIERARCAGAIVVAAAGNSSGLRCTEEPLAPAAWEEYPRPDLARCGDLGLTASAVQDTPGGYSPLVYAVGGLAGPNDSMVGTRNAGKPRMFAPASHVVAGDSMTPSMTGTSVATAAVSGAAAMVWSYRPNLAANQVMQVLYGLGVGTAATADFGLSGGGAPVRRLDLCNAVKAVCFNPAHCSGVPALTCGGPIPHPVDDLFATVDSLSPTRDVPKFAAVQAACNNACGLDAPLRVQDGLGQTCGGIERDPTLFLTRPQPPEPGCPDCTLADDFAALTVSDAQQSAVVGVTVDVLDEVTGRHYLYAVDPSMVSAGSVTEVELPLGKVVPRSAHIELSFADPDEDTRDAMIVR